MTFWYSRKWNIYEKTTSYILNPNLVSDKLQEIYDNESEIVAVRIIDKHVSTVGFGYALIEFADGRFGEAAILAEGQQVRLVPDTLANIEKMENEDNPPESVSPLNILNMLNDDCLKEIFERLPLGDLCSVADTCKKFRRIAKEIFTVQFAKLKDEVKWLKFWQVESLFRNFGNEITEFSYDFDKFDMENIGSYRWHGFHHNVIMLLLVTYCSGEKCPLKSLKIHEIGETCLDNINIHPVWNDFLEPIFGRLNCLFLDRCNVSHSLLTVCNDLIELRLVYPNSESLSAFASPTFNKLEKLTLRLSDESIDGILNRMPTNSRLKSLSIDERSNDEYNVTLIRLIGSKFPNLEELVYIEDPSGQVLDAEDADRFHPFECLKSFTFAILICDISLINELVAVHPKLKSLNIGYIQLDTEQNSKEFVKKISELKELKQLSLFGWFFDYVQLKEDLTKALPSLERLQVTDDD